MIIEVTGTNTENRGAELMLVAIRQHYEDRQDVRLAVDSVFGTYEDRARYNLLQKVNVSKPGRASLASRLMPASSRQAFGLVLDKDVSGLLDASGFAFGDQHPERRVLAFAKRVERMHRSGRPVVLLPQALGPFVNSRSRDAFRRIAAASDLIFARDDVSLESARAAAEDRHAGRIQLGPDFTNLVKAGPARREAVEYAYIVPNQRMIEKADSAELAREYVPFLLRCIRAVADVNIEVRLLVHGENDGALAGELHDASGQALPVIRERDPVAIKRLLGGARLVIGSRFHALVSALCQGVPAIGTSWSHKYEMLFRDYDCEEMLLPVTASEEMIRQCVCRAISVDSAELIHRIETNGRRLVGLAEAMWQRVDDALGVECTPAT